MSCVFSFWFVDASIGRRLAAVGTALLIAPQLATLLVVRADMVSLLMQSYEFWYITIINVLCTVLICIEYRDVRGAAAAIGSVAIENALMPDANYRIVSSLVMYSSLAGLTYLALPWYEALGLLADSTPVTLLRFRRWSIESNESSRTDSRPSWIVLLRNAVPPVPQHPQDDATTRKSALCLVPHAPALCRRVRTP
ncbi:hypothetical protein PINS_up024511 [Pythium insidiosum]|nr:hypothetical protein PINS_up024511 [Pythium insidiosum]